MSDEPGPQPDDREPQKRSHVEEGLDLARSLARTIGNAGPVKPRRRMKRRPLGEGGPASGAHPDDRDPQTLDATLGRLVAEQGWGTDVRMHGVFARWPTIVGAEVAQHVTPVSFEADRDQDGGAGRTGGRLVVRTDSTAWATQMRLLAANVVRRLNEELGDGTVAVIDVQGPNAPSWKHGRRSVRGGRGPRDTYG